MVKAVQRMQADYGIKPDGVIGSEALEILNLSDSDRARTLAVGDGTACAGSTAIPRKPASTSISPRRGSPIGATASSPDTAQGGRRQARDRDTAARIANLPARRQPHMDRAALDPEQGDRRKGRRLSSPQQYDVEGRLDRPEAGAEKFAGARQVRHAERAPNLPSRHAREAAVQRGAAPAQPWAASASRMRWLRRRCSQRTRVYRPSGRKRAPRARKASCPLARGPYRCA